VGGGGAGRAPPPGPTDALIAALESPAHASTIEQHYRTLLVGARPPAQQRVLADLHATPARTIVGVMRAMLEFDPLAALAMYPGPRLSVHTRFGDQPFSLHRLCPELRSVRVGDTGHWLQLDRPKEFNLIVDGWLGAINPARREVVVATTR
jgi:pimeloyl-ACP methyl ester carboxylesterase